MPNVKGSPLTVPHRGDPNRKRVLGVLAQRRYRDRVRNQRSLKNRVIDASTTSQIAVQNSSYRPTPSLDGFDMSSSIAPQTHLEPIDDLEINKGTSPTPEYNNVSDELQFLEMSLFTFPDDGTLEMPALKVMRAGLLVASTLACTDNIWNPAFTHVVDASLSASLQLPGNFQPVRAQLFIPHHPLFDILPWPSVRARLIQVFSSPPEMRPPLARDPLAVAYMVYDIDDESDGFRIEGEDGLDEKAWIVGQKFFTNWWWALDRDIVQRSNDARSSRGQPRLSIASTPSSH